MKHVSTLLLERYLAGDIEPSEKEAVETAMAADIKTAEAVTELRRSDEELRRRYPAGIFAARIVERAQRKCAGRRAMIAGGTIMAAAGMAALFVFLILPLTHRPLSAAALPDRMKGNTELPLSTELRAYLKTDPAVLLGDRVPLGEGNTIQLAYTVENRTAGRYGVIFSIDGRGSVTLHYPYAPAQSTLLTTGKPVPLDEAYTLDDAPEYEKFFFVVADTSLNAETVLRTAESLSRETGTDLEQRCIATFKPNEVKSLTIWKE
jgi:hypothetical protein